MGGLSTYSIFKRMALHNPDMHLLTQDEVTSVQQVLLTMMDDVHAVCMKNDLCYVLVGGCALGAIRHGGFIPWDDDIDLCMPRRDYDRLRRCIINQFGDKYYIQEITSCDQYDLNSMKIRLNGTSFCEYLEPEPERAGLFIDVFSVENIPNSPFFRRIHGIFADGMQFICSCIRIRKKKDVLLAMAGKDEEAIHAIRRKSAIAVPFCIFSFRRWLLWTERVLRGNRNEQSNDISVPTGIHHFRGEIYPRDWFFPPKEVDFSGRRYYVPAQPERYLEKMYGDYQTLPPEKERECHAVRCFSLGGREDE